MVIHWTPRLSIGAFPYTVKPVCSDHLYNKTFYLWFIQWCALMKTEGVNLLLLAKSASWSSSRWPLATLMSSRRQRNIPLGGRYRQVSLCDVIIHDVIIRYRLAAYLVCRHAPSTAARVPVVPDLTSTTTTTPATCLPARTAHAPCPTLTTTSRMIVVSHDPEPNWT